MSNQVIAVEGSFARLEHPQAELASNRGFLYLDQIGSWVPGRHTFQTFFNNEERQILDEARRSVDPKSLAPVLCSWENPFAKAGGIIMVIPPLAKALAELHGSALVYTPFNKMLPTAPDIAALLDAGTLIDRGSVMVPFGPVRHATQIFEYKKDGVSWIMPYTEHFFNADGGNPYTYRHELPAHRHTDEARLATDALFAATALPYVLCMLDVRKDIALHVHDWQMIMSAMMIKLSMLSGDIQSAVCTATLHNSYNWGLNSHKIGAITERTADDYWRDPHTWEVARTFLTKGLGFYDSAVSTVSVGNAIDLLTDPLECQVLSRDLQYTFQTQGLVGVNNRPFLTPEPAFSEEAHEAARHGDTAKILAEKVEMRGIALEHIDEIQRTKRDRRVIGEILPDSGTLMALPPDTLLAFATGRLDPNQKGIDIVSRAFEVLKPGSVKLFITVQVAETDFRSPAYSDLARFAHAHSGNVLLVPYRMEKGYLEVRAGSSVELWASIREPYGAVSEAQKCGTPVIAHAVGGLTDQVVDIRMDAVRGNGMIYRGAVNHTVSPAGEWHDILSARTMADRMTSPLYRNIVYALCHTLEAMSQVYGSAYRNGDPTYGTMLANQYSQIRDQSWAHAAQEYTQLYESGIKY